MANSSDAAYEIIQEVTIGGSVVGVVVSHDEEETGEVSILKQQAHLGDTSIGGIGISGTCTISYVAGTGIVPPLMFDLVEVVVKTLQLVNV